MSISTDGVRTLDSPDEESGHYTTPAGRSLLTAVNEASQAEQPLLTDTRGRVIAPSLGSEQWTLFGRKTQRSKVEFFSQVIILYIIILTCLVNITLEWGNRELWSALLGSSIGYLLPSPRLKSDKKSS